MSEDLRVKLTKQLIREGLLRCLAGKALDKITISELCREAGVNRATFYNHYYTPRDILIEIGWEYAETVREIFHHNRNMPLNEQLSQCFSYIHSNRKQLKIILSTNSDLYLAESITEMFSWFWTRFADIKSRIEMDEQEHSLIVNAVGWAAFHFIKQWILEDVPKPPEEMGNLVYRIMMPLF